MHKNSTMDSLRLETLNGEISFSEAVQDERNMLLQISYPSKRLEFLVYLLENRGNIEALAADHLGLKDVTRCRLVHAADWISGSFNYCLPIDIDGCGKTPQKRVMMRFPLPYKVGESHYPGNVDEKLRCEAATYIWLQENCPEIPVPKLWGFAFSDGRGVSNCTSALPFSC